MLSLLKSENKNVMIDSLSTVSFQSFLVHLRSPSVTPLFPLTAFSIASLNQTCQVYKYDEKSVGEFEWSVFFALQRSFAEIQPLHGNCAKQSNVYFTPVQLPGWWMGCV